ncbi:MAG TPA: ABC transporter permease [Actinomycetota bacterium]|nr:ABC transporter permease [Actinomycetota bacterium]
MWALVLKEFRQVRRDHRTLAMMIVMPLLLLVVFGYAASFDVDEIPTVLAGEGASGAREQLPELFQVTESHDSWDRSDAVDHLRNGDAVVAVVTSDQEPQVLIDGTELFSARSAMTALSQNPSAPEPVILFNEDLDTSAIMIPAIAGMILIFVGTMITSLGVVRERQSGTLEQLAVMPFKPRDVFVGKVAPYFLVAAIDLVVIIGVGAWLFGVPFEGAAWLLGLGALLFLFVTLGLGVLISSVSENQGQAIQLAIMSLLPQVLLSGMIFPLASMAASIRWISYLLPLTYFTQISRGVMVRGEGIGGLWFPLTMLAVLGLVIFSFAIVRFRHDLMPSKVKRSRRASAR